MFGMTIGAGGFGDETWIADVPTWKAGVFPVDESPRGTGVGSLVVVLADGSVVYDRLLERVPAADAARVVAESIREVARRAGAFPSRVRVTDPELGPLLARELKRYQVRVRCKRSRELESAVASLLETLRSERMFGSLDPVTSWTERRVGWSAVAELYAAAARYWRARPWERCTGTEALRITCDAGRWVLAISPPGDGVGATAFSREEDYELLGAPNSLMDAASGTVYGIRFGPLEELSPAVRHEAAEAAWEVADASAYPVVAGIEWEGPCLDDAFVRHLAALLDVASAIAEGTAVPNAQGRVTLAGGAIRAQVLRHESPE